MLISPNTLFLLSNHGNREAQQATTAYLSLRASFPHNTIMVWVVAGSFQLVLR